MTAQKPTLQTKPAALIRSLWGLGDNIYLRPIVRELAKKGPVFTDSPWPELYADIPDVHFYKVTRPLRTQLKNVDKQDKSIYEPEPRHTHMLWRAQYTFRDGTLFGELARSAKLDPSTLTLDLPPAPTWERGKPIALVRPVTIRTEWRNEARNPRPEYIAELAEALTDYHVICVGDIDGKVEHLVGAMPFANEYHLNGLDLPDLLGLVKSSAVVVGGVGWIVPAAIAAGAPGIIVFGGHGAHNSPNVLIEKEWQHKLQFLTPDNFHQCADMRCRKCDKTITDFSGKVQDCLDRLAARH